MSTDDLLMLATTVRDNLIDLVDDYGDAGVGARNAHRNAVVAAEELVKQIAWLRRYD